MPAQAQGRAPAGEPAWQVSEDDFLLLELGVKKFRFNHEVRGYRTPAGVCLDLADVIQALDLPVRLDKKSRRATGWLFSEDQTFTLDRDSNTVQNVNTGRAPLSDEIIDTPEGWCIDVDALSRWFGVTFKADLYNSQVRLEGADELPFLQALERRSRAAQLSGAKKKGFDLSEYDRQDTEYKVWRMPSVDTNIRTTYRGGDGSSFSARGELYATGELLGASYTARLATDDRMVPNSLRVAAYRQDPDGGLLGPLKATKVAAGDVQAEQGRLTLGGAVGRGAYVGNRPLGRNTRFSTTDLFGTLPIGWDAELYRNGQLIAFQGESDNGRYEFAQVDLYYGRNDLEVVLYGPQGQIRRENYSYPIGGANVEPGKVQYWANVLQPDTDLINLRSTGPPGGSSWRYGAGAEYGIDKRTSVGLAAHSAVVAGARRNYLEGAVYRTLGQMQLEMTAAHQLGAGGVVSLGAIGRLGTVNLGADFTKVQGFYISESISSAVDWRAGFSASTSLRMGKVSVPLQAQLARTKLSNGTTVNQLLANAAIAARGIALSASLAHGQVDDPSTLDDESETTVTVLASTRKWGIRLRGGADFRLTGNNKGAQTLRLGGEGAIGERSQLQADMRYRLIDDRAEFQLGYARSFDAFGMQARLGYDTGGAWTAGLSLNMSFGPDPVRGGMRVSEERLARQGHAKVTVFRDANGDGRRQPGEQLLEGVSITAGHRGTGGETNAEGEALVSGLRPFAPVLVGVDASTLADPFLVPAEEGLVIVPRPGIAAEITLAVLASGEVEGTVLSPAGTELAGITLELVDAGGRVVATTLSEFDGFFLFEKVPYGRYRLRVAPKSARALGVRETAGRFVEISDGADIGRMGVVRLVEAAATVAEAE